MLNYPPDLEQFVQRKIETGLFRTRDEFAVEAARLYRDVEIQREQLKADVQAAIDECNRGFSEPLDMAEIQRELCDEVDELGQPKQCLE
jgi:Arc/MetJ-type ribon-helix-helix transcriptional regulator